MLVSISKSQLQDIVLNQLSSIFGLDDNEMGSLKAFIENALSRCEKCFSFQRNKYYFRDGGVSFNPFHSGQYTIFLYYLSRCIFEVGNSLLADKVYYLNRMMNGVDLYYEVKLPSVFGLDHPLGSVIGRANYSDYFYFTQNCTVGNNHGVYPSFGRNVVMLAGSMVIGDSKVGENCIISANTYIKDEDISNNSIVFGSSPNLIIKKKNDEYFYKNSFFKHEI